MTSQNEPSSNETSVTDDAQSVDGAQMAQAQRDLPPAAQRALAEAQARREAGEVEAIGDANLPKEINGRGGKDPARYADWEVKGIAVDF